MHSKKQTKWIFENIHKLYDETIDHFPETDSEWDYYMKKVNDLCKKSRADWLMVGLLEQYMEWAGMEQRKREEVAKNEIADNEMNQMNITDFIKE